MQIVVPRRHESWHFLMVLCFVVVLWGGYRVLSVELNRACHHTCNFTQYEVHNPTCVFDPTCVSPFYRQATFEGNDLGNKNVYWMGLNGWSLPGGLSPPSGVRILAPPNAAAFVLLWSAITYLTAHHLRRRPVLRRSLLQGLVLFSLVDSVSWFVVAMRWDGFVSSAVLLEAALVVPTVTGTVALVGLAGVRSARRRTASLNGSSFDALDDRS